VVVRADSLLRDMSSYLARRIEENELIEVLLRTVVKRLRGDEQLRAVDTYRVDTQEERTLEAQALFSFIGASPRTDWLPDEIDKDEWGFVRTGTSVKHRPGTPTGQEHRNPYLLETSQPGVFAAGDVRAGSIKRIASAVGEGAMAVKLVHEYLATR
jgi:thioredoxin reductase (NADPH)